MPARTQYLRGIRRAAVVAIIALLLPPSLSGCSADRANAVVELCGDLRVPRDIDSVRVVLADQQQNVLREGVRQLWTCPGPALRNLPQTIEFAPAEGDIFVTVQGLKDGVPVIQKVLRTTFTAGDNTATVSLDRACKGVQCAAGETCVQGGCELIALAADALSTCEAPGAAPGPDASAADAGFEADAGTPNPGAYLCPQPDVGAPADTANALDAAAKGINDDEAP